MKLRFLAAISLLMMVFASCSNDGGPSATTEGKVIFAISDEAANMGSITSVKVTVDSLKLHAEGGATTDVSINSQTFDLLALKAKGETKLIAQANIDAGAYDRIELNISKAVVVDASGEHEATLPNNKLDLTGKLDVKADATATANFDFQTDQSVHVTADGSYVFAPVVRLETMANATAQVGSDNVVRITGGTLTTNVLIGMDIEGSVGAGLNIAPDAVLSISAGKILQTKGSVTIGGTVKALDIAKGTMTITTSAGKDIQLSIPGTLSSSMTGSGEIKVGSSVVTKFNAETKAATQLDTQVQVQAQAQGQTPMPTPAETQSSQPTATQSSGQASVSITGTLKAVDAISGTVTITGQAGSDVVLKVASDTKVTVDNAVSTMVGLAAKIGSTVNATYNAQTQAAASISAQAQASATAQATVQANATVTGMLKAVSAATGTVTITGQAGVDVVLKVSSDTKIMVDNAVSTVAGLAAKVGSTVTATYNAQTQAAASISAQAQAQAGATVTGTLKAVNAASGTITVAGQAGADVVLKIAADTKVTVNNATATLAALASQIGATVTATYNASTQTAATVNAQAQAQASATVTGTLKAVNTLANSVTIAVQGGADLVLNLTAQSKVLVNGSASTAAALATKINSAVTVEYNVEAKAVITLDVK